MMLEVSTSDDQHGGEIGLAGYAEKLTSMMSVDVDDEIVVYCSSPT